MDFKRTDNLSYVSFHRVTQKRKVREEKERLGKKRKGNVRATVAHFV